MDFQVLDGLVHKMLTPSAYEIGHELVSSSGGSNDSIGNTIGDRLEVPSGTGYNEFMNWIHRLPEREPPTYLGLPANAEKLLLIGQGSELISDLRKIMELLDEGEALMTES